MNKNKKIKSDNVKTNTDKKTLGKFLKAAPFTAIMILALCGFWGYKAAWAANEQLTKTESDSSTAESSNAFTEALGKLGLIETTLEAPSGNGQDAENVEGSAKAQGTDDSEGRTDVNSDNDDSQTSGQGSADAIADESSQSSETEGENNAVNNSDSEGGSSTDTAEGSADQNEEESILVRNPSEEELSKYPYSLGELDGDFVIYEPRETNSRYYSDRGRVPLDTLADYTACDDDYFDDACFIGDSRMVGIYDYSGWDNADFFCDNGFCAYNYVGGKTVHYQNEGKKVLLDDAMDRKQYGKIYIMIGTNDCGYGNTDNFKENYTKMLDMIMEKQPDAIIYLVANLRVSAKAEKEDKTGVYNNIDINDKNAAIAEIAQEKGIYFFDCNIPFVDENGYLIEEYTFDGFHVYAEQYVEMAELYRAHSIKI